MNYPVCKLWLLLTSKYQTTAPYAKFCREYSLTFYKVKKYGDNTFKKLDISFVETLCKALNCTFDDLFVDDKEYFLECRGLEGLNEVNKGIVYFVKNEKGHTKIGRTQNLKNRLQSLKYDSNGGKGIELIHSIESDNISFLEKSLHKVYADKRIQGEWFDLTQNDLNKIKILGGTQMKGTKMAKEEILIQLYELYQSTENESVFNIIGNAISFVKQQ